MLSLGANRLDSKHKWRKDNKCFDGTQELRGTPTPLIGSNILDILGDRKNVFENAQKRKRKKHDPWTKISIFFNLPYWKTNLLHHNLDVMHTEDLTDNWQVVTKTTPRDMFDVHEDLENDDRENYLEDKLKSSFFHQFMINEDEDKDENVSWFRDDVPRTTIDISAMDNH